VEFLLWIFCAVDFSLPLEKQIKKVHN
jgi:hypothetical protein